MNNKKTEQSEQIAAKILRILAIIGLVAVLALASWAIVQSAKVLPNFGGNISAAVSSITSIFRNAPEESLMFEIDNQTIAVGTSAVFAWSYVGEDSPRDYTFSYACGTDATFLLQRGAGWDDIECDREYSTNDMQLTVIPSNELTRFADVEINISTGELTDQTIVTVVNTDIFETDEVEDESSTATDEYESTTNTNTTQGSGTQTVVRRTTQPVYTGPADLVLEIQETGIILEVEDEDTFFPVSPIKSDMVAGVKFTVTNRGGETSDIWTFDALLPIEGDDEYEYNSPKQIPLASGMEIEFTLGFDEVLEEDEGTITIEIDPNDNNDKESNNEASVTIDIDVID